MPFSSGKSTLKDVVWDSTTKFTSTPPSQPARLRRFGWQANSLWYVYILRSAKDGNIYVGSTNDLDRRLKQHENGECISTSKRLPVTIEAYVAVKNHEQARSLEAYFKSGSGAAILKKQVLRLP